MPLEVGAVAPPVESVPFDQPTALYFYKVTCPVCQLSAPVAETLQRAYPGHVAGVGQDPPERLQEFSEEFGVSFPSVPDAPPYDLSNAYGIAVVPTLFLLAPGGTVLDAVESWEREGFNRVSRRLAELTGRPYSEVSEEGDGLPAFRPG